MGLIFGGFLAEVIFELVLERDGRGKGFGSWKVGLGGGAYGRRCGGKVRVSGVLVFW